MRIANILSTVFHPIFVPTYGIISLLNLNYFFFLSVQQKIFIASVVFIFTGLIPIAFSLVLLKQGQIDDINIKKREQRHILLLIALISYVTCAYMIYQMGLPIWILILFIGTLIALTAVIIINFFWKISIHTTAWGGFCGGIILISSHFPINSFLFLILNILIAGLVGTARLQLKAHTIYQVIVGYIIGFLCIIVFSFI